jgi:hypothetical protein
MRNEAAQRSKSEKSYCGECDCQGELPGDMNGRDIGEEWDESRHDKGTECRNATLQKLLWL